MHVPDSAKALASARTGGSMTRVATAATPHLHPRARRVHTVSCAHNLVTPTSPRGAQQTHRLHTYCYTAATQCGCIAAPKLHSLCGGAMNPKQRCEICQWSHRAASVVYTEAPPTTAITSSAPASNARSAAQPARKVTTSPRCSSS